MKKDAIPAENAAPLRSRDLNDTPSLSIFGMPTPTTWNSSTQNPAGVKQQLDPGSRGGRRRARKGIPPVLQRFSSKSADHEGTNNAGN